MAPSGPAAYREDVNLRRTSGLLPAALFGGAVALAFIAVGSEVGLAQMSPSPNSDSGSAAPDGLRSIERSFVVQALLACRDQAELSSLAATHARSSDIRAFAQQLVTDYRQIDTALETLARHKAIDVPLQPTSYSDHYRALIESSGNGFDRAFVQAVATANDRTMRLVASVLAEAKDPEIRELAGNMLPVIRDHANKTTELQKTF